MLNYSSDFSMVNLRCKVQGALQVFQAKYGYRQITQITLDLGHVVYRSFQLLDFVGHG